MDALLHDLRSALHSLKRSPGLTLAAVVTLGLGIGANTAMFGVIDSLFFRPPAHVTDPASLLRMNSDGGSIRAYPRILDQRRNATSFSAVEASFGPRSMSLGRGADARKIRAVLATAGLFPMLGVQPLLGRFFTEEEDRAGSAADLVVLSAEFWQSQMGGSPDALGRQLFVGQRSYTVIGVAPARFSGVDLERPDVWLPMSATAPEVVFKDAMNCDNCAWLQPVVRLAPGVTPEAAIAEATAIYRRRIVQGADSTTRITLGPLNQALGIDATRGVQLSTWLAAACGIVLLIACVNVANLLLARATQRQREMAVRTALGSPRHRLITQLYLESALLAAFGGVAALFATWWIGPLLHRALLPDATPSAVDLRVFLFTFVVAGGTTLLAGLAPVLYATTPDLNSALKSGVREGGTRRSLVQTSLLISQIALTVILLSGAGLFVRSLGQIQALRLGFDPDQVMVAMVDLATIRAGKDAIRAEYEQMQARAALVPGVERTALSIGVPFRYNIGISLRSPGADTVPDMHGPYLNAVTPDYFATLGTRVLRGRGITAQDLAGAPRVIVVSETIARLVWPGTEALGRCLQTNGADSPCREVVGVVEDGRQDRMTDPVAQTFIPLAQADDPAVDMPVTSLVIRTTGPAGELTERVRRAIQSTSADLPYVALDPMPELFAQQIRPWRLGALLFGLFGVLALILGAVGVYGVMSYATSRRTHEMGVRQALGAQRGQILRQVIWQGFGLTMIGVAFGLGGALLAGRALASLVYRISPYDPVTLGAVSLILAVVAIAASLVPAWRATRVSPMVALREE